MMTNEEAYIAQMKDLPDRSEELWQLQLLQSNYLGKVPYSFAFDEGGTARLSIGDTLFSVERYPILTAQLEDQIRAVNSMLHYSRLEELGRLKEAMKRTDTAFRKKEMECLQVLLLIEKRK